MYVSGYSDATWGSPVNAYAGGGDDAFAAKLNSSGALQWNTFMGASGNDTRLVPSRWTGAGTCTWLGQELVPPGARR